MAVIHGQDAVNCTKMSLCVKQREKIQEVEKEAGSVAHCKCAHSFRRQCGLAIFKLSH